jgi:phospholipid/cholesterol/gamma-HCH transport system substrate-binding protein|tara:strand:- start:840 stop:1790 length:951 start_codon:yes stop_codon:yes gene_type:complete
LKITKEIKTGILALFAILLLIYGYGFLKGSDLFSNERTFYVSYDNVAGLTVSAPVTINGYVVGQVKKIEFENDLGGLLVTFSVTKNFNFSKNSIVRIYSTSVIGGNALAIIPEIDKDRIAIDGDVLKGEIEKGMLESLTSGLKPLENKIYTTLSGLDSLLINLNSVLNKDTKNNLKDAISSLTKTVYSFEDSSSDLNSLLKENKPKLDSTFSNMETITDNLAVFSDSITQIDIKAISNNLETTLDSFNSIMDKFNNGEGSIGKLINDENLYKNLEAASKELEELLRDLKENPKRYVHISVFGKKEKEYEPIDSTNK